jgi:hypothetical protein
MSPSMACERRVMPTLADRFLGPRFGKAPAAGNGWLIGTQMVTAAVSRDAIRFLNNSLPVPTKQPF